MAGGASTKDISGERTDAYKNMVVGIAHLSELLKAYNSKESALAVYNGGPRALLRNGEISSAAGYAETRNYVPSIMAMYNGSAPIKPAALGIFRGTVPDGDKILAGLEQAKRPLSDRIADDKAKLTADGYKVFVVKIKPIEEFGAAPYVIGSAPNGELMIYRIGDKTAGKFENPDIKLENGEVVIGIPENEMRTAEAKFRDVINQLRTGFANFAGEDINKVAWLFTPAKPVHQFTDASGSIQMAQLVSAEVSPDSVVKKERSQISAELASEPQTGRTILKSGERTQPVYAPVNAVITDISGQGADLKVTIAWTVPGEANAAIKFELTLSRLGAVKQSIEIGDKIKQGDVLALASPNENGGSEVVAELKVNGARVALQGMVEKDLTVEQSQVHEVTMALAKNFGIVAEGQPLPPTWPRNLNPNCRRWKKIKATEGGA